MFLQVRWLPQLPEDRSLQSLQGSHPLHVLLNHPCFLWDPSLLQVLLLRSVRGLLVPLKLQELH